MVMVAQCGGDNPLQAHGKSALPTAYLTLCDVPSGLGLSGQSTTRCKSAYPSTVYTVGTYICSSVAASGRYERASGGGCGDGLPARVHRHSTTQHVLIALHAGLVLVVCGCCGSFGLTSHQWFLGSTRFAFLHSTTVGLHRWLTYLIVK